MTKLVDVRLTEDDAGALLWIVAEQIDRHMALLEHMPALGSGAWRERTRERLALLERVHAALAEKAEL